MVKTMRRGGFAASRKQPQDRRTDVVGNVRHYDVIFGANQGGDIRFQDVFKHEVDVCAIIKAFFKQGLQARIDFDS